MIEKTPLASSVIRRRCLCIVLVAALFVILADVGITALLLYYVNLSKHSIGEIQLNYQQTLINGRLFVDKGITTAKMLASGDTLYLISQRHIDIVSREINGRSGGLHIDKKVALVQADNVNFKNKDGEEYLLLSKDNMEANINLLNLKGKARSIPSIQTRSILSSHLSNLRISSPTKDAELTSASTLKLQSSGGGIIAESLSDINFISSNISLYSPQIFLRSILQDEDNKQVDSNTSSSTQTASKMAYELCVCGETGKLFASSDNCLNANNEGC